MHRFFIAAALCAAALGADDDDYESPVKQVREAKAAEAEAPDEPEEDPAKIKFMQGMAEARRWRVQRERDEKIREHYRRMEEAETEAFKKPREVSRRAAVAFEWGDKNASVTLGTHAVILAQRVEREEAKEEGEGEENYEKDERGVEWRRVYAGKLATMMYYADEPCQAADLLGSLVSDLDFSDAGLIQTEAARVIWLGAAHMRCASGDVDLKEEWEELKALAVDHINNRTLAWDKGNSCLKAAFQLFMINSERAMKDLDACLDSKNDEDRFMANLYLAVYADARYKDALSRAYGKEAFRLITFPPTSYNMKIAHAHARNRWVEMRTDCPCLDDRFFKDKEGSECKEHEGYDCTTYAHWHDSDWTMAEMVDVLDHCPKSCGLCQADPPCAVQELDEAQKKFRRKKLKDAKKKGKRLKATKAAFEL